MFRNYCSHDSLNFKSSTLNILWEDSIVLQKNVDFLSQYVVICSVLPVNSDIGQVTPVILHTVQWIIFPLLEMIYYLPLLTW